MTRDLERIPALPKNELAERAEVLFGQCLDVMARKNSDYTQGDRELDAFRNFRLCEETGVTTVENGFLTRLEDKLMRAIGLIQGHNPEVQDESLLDTLRDSINYTALLYLWLEHVHGCEIKAKNEWVRED